MKFYQTLKTAMRGLRRNVMRAALTTLGIVIGVAAVIAMMEIGNGSSIAIQRTIASMGANNLLILPGTAASGGVSFGAGSVMTLTPGDAEAIARECPAVGSVAPAVRARTQVVYGNRNWVPHVHLRHHARLSGSARLDGHGRGRTIHRPGRAQLQQGLFDRPDVGAGTLRQANRRSAKRSACRTSPSRSSACFGPKAPT